MPKVNMYAAEKEYIHLVKQGPAGTLLTALTRGAPRIIVRVAAEKNTHKRVVTASTRGAPRIIVRVAEETIRISVL